MKMFFKMSLEKFKLSQDSGLFSSNMVSASSFWISDCQINSIWSLLLTFTQNINKTDQSCCFSFKKNVKSSSKVMTRVGRGNL